MTTTWKSMLQSRSPHLKGALLLILALLAVFLLLKGDIEDIQSRCLEKSFCPVAAQSYPG